MKLNIIFVFRLLFTQPINAQKIDSISISTIPTIGKENEIQLSDLVGRMGPSLIGGEKVHYKLIVNGFLISDTIKSNLFLKRFKNQIHRFKFYTSTKGFKKFGISSKDGILFCRLKSNIIINMETLQRANK